MASLEANSGGGGGSAPPGPLKALKLEAVAAKQKWGDEVKVTQPKKDAPGFPWPVSVTRTIPRPDKASSWEVWELVVKVKAEGKGDAEQGKLPPLSAQVSADVVVPDRLGVAMANHVLAQWRALLGQRQGPTDHRWFVDELLTWCEEHFVEILSVLPPYVNRFIAVTDQGHNCWRFTILEPTAPPPAEEEDIELTEEQRANEIARLEREAARQAAAEAERQAYAEERRRLAELEGPAFRQMSKKEMEEIKAAKRGQGNRTAKTGSRRKKFDGEGSKLEKDGKGRPKE